MTTKTRTVSRRSRLAVLALGVALGSMVAGGSADACEKRAELAKRRAEIAKSSDVAAADRAHAHYELGAWAQANGLVQEARDAFERAIELNPDHAAARDELGYVRHDGRWLSQAESMEKKGLVLRAGRWILREEAAALDLPEQQRELRREGQAKVRKLLGLYESGGERARKFAVESLGTIDDGHKLEPLAFALRSKSADVRQLAARELGDLENRRALRPLLHRAVYDPVEEVRHAAIDAAKQIGDPNLIAPLVGALDSEQPRTRMNAAMAIARAGDPIGVQYLVYRFEAHGGGAPRAYSMFARQLTFIQDFDVQVAQTAFIADPQPGVIQEGTVLDAQVVATQQTSYYVEREVIHGALQRLTGASDVPNEDGAWAAWLKEHGDELASAR